MAWNLSGAALETAVEVLKPVQGIKQLNGRFTHEICGSVWWVICLIAKRMRSMATRIV